MITTEKTWGQRVGAAIFAIVLALGCSVGAAHAQFVCVDSAGDSGGAAATGGAALACGPRAQATGNFSTATGNRAEATGGSSTATGDLAKASGDFSTATGARAEATGDFSTATGVQAQATGDSATAMGRGAVAAHANATAIGAGAETTRDNQMVFGKQSNTYTMGGITSEASKAAQQGPLEVVTADAFGNLASDGGALQRKIDGLGRRDRELADGIAIALAIQQPIFQPGQSFALRAGYGNFDGTDAFGLSAAGVIDRGSFGRGSSVTLDAGIGFGTGTGTAAAKAGVTLGW